MPRREFHYPINEREIYVSENAIRAGEATFGRPADLNERKTKLPYTAATQEELLAALNAFKGEVEGHPHLQADYRSIRAAVNAVLERRAEQPLCAVCKDKQASICSLCHSEELYRTSQAEGLITKEYAREHGAVFPGD